MNDIIVTVIIPVFNLEKYIIDCLKSLSAQTYNNFEIILIDDGSNDNSEIIINNFIKENKNMAIRLIKQDHQGVSIARNTGIELSLGEFIIFIDGDDTVENNYIELLHHSISESKSDLGFCGYNMISEKGKFISSYDQIFSFFYENITGVELLEIFFNNKINIFCWNTILRKNIILENKLKFSSNISYGEDIEFMMKYILNSKKTVCTSKNLYNYRQRSTSAIGNKGNYKYFQTIKVLINIKEIIKDTSYTNLRNLLQINKLPKNLITVLRSWSIYEQKHKFRLLVKSPFAKKILCNGISIKYFDHKRLIFSMILLTIPNIFYYFFNLKIIKKIKGYGVF